MNANRNSKLKELLCNQRAYIIFRYAAWCVIPVAVVFLIALTPAYKTITSNLATRIAFQIVSGCVGVLGAAAGIAILFGMLAYLLWVDRSPWKLLWLIVFLFTAFFGGAIYFFAVYRRQVLPHLALRIGSTSRTG